jgi:hypothetical protein
MKNRLRQLKNLFNPDPLADLLSGLGPGFVNANAVGSKIDYVVIGERSGPFVLQVEKRRGLLAWEGELPVFNGQPFDPTLLERAAQNKAWLREQIHSVLGLTVWVSGVVVYARAQVQPGPPVRGVHLVDRQYLGPLLKMPRSANPANLVLWEGRERLLKSLQ